MFEELLTLIRANQIPAVILRDQILENDKLERLAAALEDNQSVTFVKLVNNAVNIKGMRTLLEVLAEKSPPLTVELDNSTDDVFLMELQDVFLRNNLFKQLLAQIRANQISAITSGTRIPEITYSLNAGELSQLTEALQDNQSVTVLCLGVKQIKAIGMQRWCEMLKKNQSLIDLTLSRDEGDDEIDFDDVNIQILSEFLKINQTLTEVKFYNNHIGDMGAQALSDALKINSTLTMLWLSGNQIGAVSAQAISEALKVNLTLATLWLGDNQISAVGAQAISEALKVNQTLATLRLINNQIDAVGAQAISEALKVNQKLTVLYLDNNQIGDVGAQAISEALKINKTLTKLWLGDNQIGDVGAQAISEALKVNQTLTVLYLSCNQIGDMGAQTLCDVLTVNRMPITLYLSFNPCRHRYTQAIEEVYQQKVFERLLVQIRTNQISEIALDRKTYSYLNALQIKQLLETLKYNQLITNVSLCDYPIDNMDVQTLSEMLRVKHTLTSLKLHGTRIGDMQVQVLSEALTENQSLKAIYFNERDGFFSSNDEVFIGDSGVRELSAMLRVNRTLAILDLYKHKISDEGIQALCEALSVNHSLTVLNLDAGCNRLSGRISDNGAQMLSEMLKINSTLITLNLGGNRIGALGVHEISEALKVNQTLKVLNLNFNSMMGIAGAKAISQALKINRSLTTLELVDSGIGDEGAVALAETMLVNPILIKIDLRKNVFGAETGFALMVAVAKNHSITYFKMGRYNSNYYIVDDREDGHHAEAIEKILTLRRNEQIKTVRNQTLLTILILLRHARALEGHRWPGSQETLGPLPRYHLPADIWRLICHWFDFPSVEKGYRTSREVVEYLSQKNIFTEFNQRLQNDESFRLIETSGIKVGESRFSFLMPRKLPNSQPKALMENEIELEPVRARPKREKTSAAEDVELELASPQDTKRFKH